MWDTSDKCIEKFLRRKVSFEVRHDFETLEIKLHIKRDNTCMREKACEKLW